MPQPAPEKSPPSARVVLAAGAVVAATLGMLAVNGLANALPINGQTTGEVSDGFDILFTPAGYVFSIWGLIYSGLIAFAAVQAFSSLRTHRAIAAIRPWYLLNAAANATWLVAWHYEQFVASWVVMGVLLGSLVAINRKLDATAPPSALWSATVRAPFRLYLGWISVATIANTTVVLSRAGMTGVLADPFWTLLLLIAATVLCLVVSLRRADLVYACVFAWALVGIGTKHADLPVLHVGALLLAGVCALAVARILKARISDVRFSDKTATRTALR